MRYIVTQILFLSIILFSITSHSDVTYFFYATMVLTSVAIACVYFIYRSSIAVPTLPLFLTILISLTILIHLPESLLDVESTARTVTFIFITPIYIFIIPKLITRRDFLTITAFTSSIFVIIGLPSAIIGDYNIILFDSTVSNEHPWIDFYRIESISTTTVTSGYIAFIGMIASLAARTKLLRYIFFITCLLGVILPHSRAAYLSGLASLTIIFLHKYIGREYMKPIILTSFVIGTYMFLSFMRLIPTPGILEVFHPAGRDDIFQAGVDAFLSAPFFGHGLGNMSQIVGEYSNRSVGAGAYNQFLRMFISVGVIGGGAYLILIISAVVKYPTQHANWNSILIYSIFIGIFVNELFTGRGIMGLSHSSIIGAISLGYIYTDMYDGLSYEAQRAEPKCND